MELWVQPNQAKVSSGGGGGGNEGGWGDNDNDKEMRKSGVPTIKEQLKKYWKYQHATLRMTGMFQKRRGRSRASYRDCGR